jgi:hypothetical protein
MAADPNIFQQYLKPVRSMQDYSNEMDQAETNALALAGQRQTAADERAVRAAYQQSGGDQNKLMQALQAGGQYKAAQAMQDKLLGQQKTQGDINKQKTELIDARLKQSRNYLDTVQTPEQYIAWHEANHSDPILGPELTSRGVTAEQARASIMEALKKPGGFEDMLNKSKLGIEKFTEMNKPTIQTQNLGGTSRVTSMPGLGGAPTILSDTPITQSADSKAAAASAAAQRAQAERASLRADARAKDAQLSGKVPTGYRANPDGSMSFIPGGPADPNAVGGGKMTEDQGKATGWLVQAENAFKNMGAAMKSNPSAARPGFNDALAAIPSFGATEAIANSMRGADRQKFMQGSSSLSEALLRAATGAGVNRDEAAQKIRELTPVFGESDSTTEQKMAAIPLYIESLKVRAGPGARKAAQVMQKQASGDIHSQAEAILRGK